MPLTPERISQLRQMFRSGEGDTIDRLILQNGNSALVADFVDKVATALQSDYDTSQFVAALQTLGVNLSALIRFYGYTDEEPTEQFTMDSVITQLLENTKSVVEKTGDYANGYANGALNGLLVLYAAENKFQSATQNYTFASPLLQDIEWQKPLFNTPDGKWAEGCEPLRVNGEIQLANNGAGMNLDKTGNPNVPRITSTQYLFYNTRGFLNADLYISAAGNSDGFTCTYIFSESNARGVTFADDFNGNLDNTFRNSKIQYVYNFQAKQRVLSFSNIPFRGSAIVDLTFATNYKIFFSFADTSLGYGYNSVLPNSLNIASIKRYIEHLYDWATDADNMFDYVINNHTLRDWYENGTDYYTIRWDEYVNGVNQKNQKLHRWCFVGLYSNHFGGIEAYPTQQVRSLMRRTFLTPAMIATLRADSEGALYEQMVTNKGWQPLTEIVP